MTGGTDDAEKMTALTCGASHVKVILLRVIFLFFFIILLLTISDNYNTILTDYEHSFVNKKENE